MTGPDVTGVDEYAEKAARLTEAEARKLAVSAAHEAFDAACVRDAHRCMTYGLPVSYTTVRGLLARFDRQEALLAEARAEERERIAEALVTCSCGCDVTNHYTVCSTYGCPCRLDRDRAQLVAADHAARIARGEAAS